VIQPVATPPDPSGPDATISDSLKALNCRNATSLEHLRQILHAWRGAPETVVVVLGEVGRSNSGSFCPVGRAAGVRSGERMLVQGEALRGDQGLGGCASRGRGEDDDAKALVPDDVAVELEQA
jgi:hypothetical protein